MHTLSSLFQQIRKTYLHDLKKEIEVYNNTFEHTLIEALVELGGKGNLPPAFQLHRVDMVSNSDNYTDFSECNSINTVYFKPRNIQLNHKTSLRLEPFLWQSVDIECRGSDLDSRVLQRWIYHWINDQHRDRDCPFQLKGCVHGIKVANESAPLNCFSVDLGSAKETALIELLHLLSKSNAEHIRVFSNALYE